jgi:hypothetical protein
MPKTEKIDLYKLHKAEYVTPKEPVLVEVKPARYLTIVGQGEPGGELFQAKLGALYAVAFTLKMTKKFAGQDYRVGHLEGLWWVGSKKQCLFEQPPSAWKWKLIIRVPDFITERDLQQTVQKLKAKGKAPEAGEVRLETIQEGRCVQALHVGPYAKENETVARMMAFAEQQGLSSHGLHHEIYLSDPRRVPAERLRTILRHPVR